MSDTYQSRVFSFISKRTHSLKDSCSKGLRHLKIAVVWTGQVLLYPLHLLAQTAKYLTHQLPSTEPKKFLPQPAPALEIEQALAIVADVGYEIASADRQSMVVDDWSYIDDEIWQTGHGNAAVASRELTYQPLAIERSQSTKPNGLPSVLSRFLPEGTSGARAAAPAIVRGLSSLLSDRSIVLVTTENEIIDALNVFQQQEIRRRIGVDLAIDWHRWQQHRLQYRRADNLPWDESDLLLAGNDPQSLALLSGTEVTIDPERATLFDRFQNWLDSFKPKPEPQPMFGLETLDRDIETLPPQLTATSYSFTPQPPRFERAIPQTGHFKELGASHYARELPQLPPVIDRSTHAEVNSHSPLAPNWLRNWWNFYRDYLYIPPTPDSQIVHQLTQTEFQLIPLEPEPKQPAIDKHSDRSSINLSAQKPHQHPKFNPEWLDVESEDLGHSRSIFQRILIWLDGLMLKIENWLIKIWEVITNKPTHN